MPTLKPTALKSAVSVAALSLFVLGSQSLPAAAAPACLEDLAKIRQQHDSTRAQLDDAERRNLTTLMQSAGILANQDQEEACEEVTEAIQEILDERREELVEQGVVLEIEREQRLRTLAEAQPLDGQRAALRASEIMGADLRNLQDESLGSIEDVIVESGGRQVTFLLVSSGGFLGFGSDLVAVPAEQARATPDLNTVVLPFTEDQLESAPKVTGSGLKRLQDDNWRQENLAYFQNLPQESPQLAPTPEELPEEAAQEGGEEQPVTTTQ